MHATRKQNKLKMTLNSSGSSRVSKRELRSKQSVTKKRKTPKKGRVNKEIRNVDFNREDIPSELDRNAIPGDISEDIPNIGLGTVQNKSPNGSAAAQQLEMLYQYENRKNQFEYDDQLSDDYQLNDENRDGEEQTRALERDDNVSDGYQSDVADGIQNQGGVAGGIQNDEAHPDQNDVAAIDYYRRKEKKREKRELERYNDLKKDFQAANTRIHQLSKEWKAVKSIVQRWGPQPSSDDEDDEDYDELPLFPLKKFKQVILMQENIKSRVYKKQFIAKLRSIGGSTVKKNVINIFKFLFSSKLKTKICWKGSARGKKPFQNFDQILNVLRQAVKYRFKKCSADDIATECKLRFKQADKDYDRELLKHQMLD